jgi:inhibitor of KinA sporulation pathway (predicted exonuclease)
MFNLPKKIVVFDTEFTAWEGSLERDWRGEDEYREIVQIGAVIVETDNFDELDSFSVFVKPKVNPKLSEYFTNLTKITQKEVNEEGIDFETAINRFSEWSGDLHLYSWGKGDQKAFKESSKLANIELPFKELRFHTVKDIFSDNGISTEGYMSSTIIEAFGKKPAREGHDALNDAMTIVDALKELKKISR